MHSRRESSGIPVPSAWQLLIAAAAICAIWLVWSEFRGPGRGSSDQAGAAESETEVALNTLRSIEELGNREGEGVPELIKLLENPDPKVRRYALLVLRRLGPQAIEAIDMICELMSDPEVREYAIESYWHIRRDASAVSQAIVAYLGDEEEPVRVTAARTLVRIGPPAIPRLVEALECEKVAARLMALKILWRIGWDQPRKDIDEAVRKLTGDADPKVRVAALQTLVGWGRPLPAEIRELLAQPVGINSGSIVPGAGRDPRPQETALSAIIRLGPDAVENLPDVLALFAKKPEGAGPHRGMALDALRRMKVEARPAVPRLFELFDESESYYRSEIGWTLVEIGADRQEVIDRLLPLLAGADGDDCRAAGRLLAYASPKEGRRQVAALIPQIAPDQIAQHRSALHALTGLAAVAPEAVPALTALLQEPLDPYSFWRLVIMFGEIGPDAAPAVPVLVGLLQRDPATLKFSHRLAMIESLGMLGSVARPAVPVLLSELKTIKSHHNSTAEDKREQTRSLETVIRALAFIDGQDVRVSAALRAQLTSHDADASNAALDMLLQLSPDSPDLLVELLNRRPVGSLNPRREGWILAIARMTCDRHDAIGPLTEVLRVGDSVARKAAAWVLGKLGSDARSALPALQEALSDWQNSLYEPRIAMFASASSSIWDEIYGWRRSRIWQSFFETTGDERPQFGRQSSVRDVVREAILRIDPAADLPETQPSF